MKSTSIFLLNSCYVTRGTLFLRRTCTKVGKPGYDTRHDEEEFRFGRNGLFQFAQVWHATYSLRLVYYSTMLKRRHKLFQLVTCHMKAIRFIDFHYKIRRPICLLFRRLLCSRRFIIGFSIVFLVPLLDLYSKR